MKWFSKLERKYSKYAIKNLMFYIIALYAFGFIINLFYPIVYVEYFSLNAEMILHGQVWRIITFIIQPTTTSVIFIFFSLYLYYMIGTVLERAWGAFRFNVYFFMGVILHVLAAILIYLVFGVNLQLNTYYLNMALFMAFATVQPDMQLLLFFFIPIKIKWLAYLDAAFFIATIVFGYLTPWLPTNIWLGLSSIGVLPAPGYVYSAYVLATAALVSMLNFIVFFLISRSNQKTKTQKRYSQAMKDNYKGFGGSTKQNNQAGTSSTNSTNSTSGTSDANVTNKYHKITKHKCAVCGKTENDGDDLIFRFCSKCEGNYEYCSEHLYTHKHVTNETKENVSNFPNNN
ncbi:rhomboid family intramembrane serine protease [[Clostridium] fimetarium]|uniref:Membrane associated serine protease, rhomboid family n=1 Tax=[Clostridium] fimetarium TaxID=99656 RepID=A0A1I0PYH5_9FIRM|nr:rhomboid family intramembrane serine protease [[Clostridium] fimetarium]SEW19513.1 Membrane associated serine protease, rhomboid family [[Clostridium] fimetarium]